MYLWASEWEKKRINASISYLKPQDVMFGVEKYSQALEKVASRYGINVRFKHNLVEIKKEGIAVFKNLLTEDLIEYPFDMLHMIPSMGPHSYIA